MQLRVTVIILEDFICILLAKGDKTIKTIPKDNKVTLPITRGTTFMTLKFGVIPILKQLNSSI